MKLCLLPWLILCLGTSRGFAYMVYIGVGSTSHQAARQLDSFKNTAALAEGMSGGGGIVKGTPGTPSAGEISATKEDYARIIGAFKCRDNVEDGLAKSTVVKHGLEKSIEAMFAQAGEYGETIRSLGFYDNKNNGKYYAWTQADVQAMRDYLDKTGRQEVGIKYDARNNGREVRAWCENPLVTAILMEANADKWFRNAGDRLELLKWLWTNPKTAHKPIILMMPGADNPYGPDNNFMKTRRAIRYLGLKMGWDFLQSKRVIIKPVTYNREHMIFCPETTEDGAKYVNSITGLTLSLLEQRELMEGRARIPTEADCNSMGRKAIVPN